MSIIDRRERLKEHPFNYHITKDQQLHIRWQGKTVTILKDRKADPIIQKLSEADDYEKQLILAKATGNFKRGNER